jgi:hypothetical protein
MPLQLLGISRSGDLECFQCGHPDDIQRAELSHSDPSSQSPLLHVHWVRQGALAAATSVALPAATGPLQHARLLAAIYRHISILPARYGTVLPDDEAVRRFLDSHGEDLARESERLRGTAEMGLRIELPHSRGPAEGAGRSSAVPGGAAPSGATPASYMAARRARYRCQDRLAAQSQWVADTYLRALKGLIRDWQRRSPEPPGMVRLAFLVEVEQAAAFARRVAMLRSMQLGQQCTLFGPWPPYSFLEAIPHQKMGIVAGSAVLG